MNDYTQQLQRDVTYILQEMGPHIKNRDPDVILDSLEERYGEESEAFEARADLIRDILSRASISISSIDSGTIIMAVVVDAGRVF